MSPPARPAIERFWSRFVRDDNGCWLWTGAPARGGYGTIDVDHRNVRVHRFAYETLVEPIPEGLTIDHLCRVRRCVNPAHMEPVTNAENVRRAKRLITHCPQGHPYDEANTIIRRQGWRDCRACNRDARIAERQAAGLRSEAVQCAGTSWRGRCGMRTVDPSGVCALHRA